MSDPELTFEIILLPCFRGGYYLRRHDRKQGAQPHLNMDLFRAMSSEFAAEGGPIIRTVPSMLYHQMCGEKKREVKRFIPAYCKIMQSAARTIPGTCLIGSMSWQDPLLQPAQPQPWRGNACIAAGVETFPM